MYVTCVSPLQFVVTYLCNHFHSLTFYIYIPILHFCSFMVTYLLCKRICNASMNVYFQIWDFSVNIVSHPSINVIAAPAPCYPKGKDATWASGQCQCRKKKQCKGKWVKCKKGKKCPKKHVCCCPRDFWNKDCDGKKHY